jgi:hypothetical protein
MTMAVEQAVDAGTLSSCGYLVPRGPEYLGTLRASTHLVDDPEALRERMAEDGYLYLRDYLDRVQHTYGQKDVDRYCSNRADADQWLSGAKRWGGWLARNPVLLRERLGGRWLTADFRVGDVLVFGMDTIHASLDNQTSSLRISCDSRYQLASEPVDERWVGDNPAGHTSAGKRGRIC